MLPMGIIFGAKHGSIIIFFVFLQRQRHLSFHQTLKMDAHGI